MPILFQIISEQRQNHCQTSVIPSSAKPIVFARKIQPNWEFAPAISRVTTRSFVTPMLPQPCTTHVLQHPRAEAGQLVPYPPAPLPSPAAPLPPPTCNLPIPPNVPPPHPAPSFYHPAARQKREEKAAGKRGGNRTRWAIGAGHRLFVHRRKETGLKIQGTRPQKPHNGPAHL